MVYTKIVPDCAKRTLKAIIRGKVGLERAIHSDFWRCYNGLVDLGYKKHYRVHHGNNEFSNSKRHIYGIDRGTSLMFRMDNLSAAIVASRIFPESFSGFNRAYPASLTPSPGVAE